MDCLFCHRDNARLYGRWYSRVRRCSRCGAYYPFRFPPIWPIPPGLVRSQWEPIKLPRTEVYYGYVANLKIVFFRLRDGFRPESLAEEARAAVPLCDLIRFWNDDDHQQYLETVGEPMGGILKLAIEKASNPAIPSPELPDLSRFHAICDYGSWCLSQFGSGQIDLYTAQQIGDFLHNFPEAYGFRRDDKEAQSVFERAVAGDLPSPGRLAMRARLVAQFK